VEEIPQIALFGPGRGAQVQRGVLKLIETSDTQVTVGGGTETGKAHVVEW
jgi:hypothetical protein